MNIRHSSKWQRVNDIFNFFNNQTHKQLNIMLAKVEQYTKLIFLNYKFTILKNQSKN